MVEVIFDIKITSFCYIGKVKTCTNPTYEFILKDISSRAV